MDLDCDWSPRSTCSISVKWGFTSVAAPFQIFLFSLLSLQHHWSFAGSTVVTVADVIRWIFQLSLLFFFPVVQTQVENL